MLRPLPPPPPQDQQKRLEEGAAKQQYDAKLGLQRRRNRAVAVREHKQACKESDGKLLEKQKFMTMQATTQAELLRMATDTEKGRYTALPRGVGFSILLGGGVNRAPQNWGGGGQEKVSID